MTKLLHLLTFFLLFFNQASLAFDSCRVIVLAQSEVAAQNDFGKPHYLSAGSRHAGICFGNSLLYNGVRMNVSDRHVTAVNGINLGFLSRSHQVNGLSLGILLDEDNSKFSGLGVDSGDTNSTRNGISISGIATQLYNINGLTLSGIITKGEGTYNGLGVAGLSVQADHFNGMAVAAAVVGGNHFNGFALAAIVAGGNLNGMGIGGWAAGDTLSGLFMGLVGGPRGLGPGNSVKQMNGLYLSFIGIEATEINGAAICGVVVSADTVHGISIALFNYAKKLHGLQVGLFNVAENNHGILKYLPGMNFHR